MCEIEIKGDFTFDDSNFNPKLNLNKLILTCDVKFGYDPKINEYRNKIDLINPIIWKKIRIYINKHDFQVTYPIINRAFYKYWEIINKYNIFENYQITDIIFHCAESPGGFIQGSNIFLNLKNESTIIDEDGFEMKVKNNIKIYTMSLNKNIKKYNKYNLPSYNKEIINKHVRISYGKDSTGNINNLENIDHILCLSKQEFYLITGDGGFDEGIDFNNKEKLHYNLILSEIYAAIKLQKMDGHFILKIFDIFSETTVHFIYLLKLCYKSVFVYKCKTSRPSNSEKYIICKNFKLNIFQRTRILDKLTAFKKKIELVDQTHLSFTLFNSIPDSFIHTINNINTIFINNQCIYLDLAIDLCNNTSFLENYDSFIKESNYIRINAFDSWKNEFKFLK